MNLYFISRLKTRRKHIARGFTLVELMVTIAIIAIIAKLALPSFQAMIQANRIQAAASEFQAGLAMARAEAIKRGGDARVTIVANELISGAANWNAGFTVFYDTTTNAGGNAAPVGAVLLMKTAALNPSMTMSSNAPNYVTFNGLGRSILSAGNFSAAQFSFGPAADATNADYRCIVMSATGRTRSEKIAQASFSSCPTY